MIPRWRLAYSYAKISGKLAKSFLGPRVGLLAECQNAHELYGLVFSGIPPQLPVPELIDEAGRALSDRLIGTYALVQRLFGGGNEFLSQVIRRVEFDNAKTVLLSLRRKDPSLPELKPAMELSEIRREAYPDQRALFEGTRFAWLGETALEGDIWEIGNRLDRQYFAELMECANRLPRKDMPAIRSILAAEARLLNSVWALRLSVYYQMDASRIADHLISFPGMDVSKEALAASRIAPDDKAAWSDWTFAPLLNKESRSTPWRIDPAEVERAAGQRMYTALRRLFHRGPFSLIPAYAFLRLKAREGDFIRSSFEGMRMSMTSRELGSMLGVQT